MSEQLTVTRLFTAKGDLGRTEIDIGQEPASVAAGEVLLKVDRFSLTTNNITYAAFGDAMYYWSFFPTPHAAWGHMPVWGFADVVASGVAHIEIGERFYGYYPIASHVRMRPERVTQRGFYDGAEHRRSLTSAYNQYARCGADPFYTKHLETYQALLRPLFLTSFMLADFLDDNYFFGARQMIVSSASSKTAYGVAFCVKDRERIRIVGLTSARNAGFVRGLGCYDATIGYDDLTTLDRNKPTIYVDFSGDETLRARVHDHFGHALVYDCFAGSAANSEFLKDTALPGPTPKFYFAPVQIKKRNADWGPAEVNRRFNEAQTRFIERVSRPRFFWKTFPTTG